MTKELGYDETVTQVLPVVKALADDIEPVVRAASMEKSFSLADFLIEVNPLSFFLFLPFFLSSAILMNPKQTKKQKKTSRMEERVERMLSLRKSFPLCASYW
jgi:hypothetical protein